MRGRLLCVCAFCLFVCLQPDTSSSALAETAVAATAEAADAEAVAAAEVGLGMVCGSPRNLSNANHRLRRTHFLAAIRSRTRAATNPKSALRPSTSVAS